MASSDMTCIRIDDTQNYVPSPQFSIGTILSYYTHNLKYMSCDAMLQLMERSVRLLRELGADNRGTNSISDHCEYLREKRHHWEEDTLPPLYQREDEIFREELMSTIVEYIMRAEGMGMLHGFNYVSFETTEDCTKRTLGTICNPEKVPTWDK